MARTRFAEEITFGNFTVLVGANNVGKSQTLRDIRTRVVSPGERTILLENLIVERPTAFEDLFRGVQTSEHPTQIGTTVVRGITSNLTSGEEIGLNLDSLREEYQNAEDGAPFLGRLGRFSVAYLDAASRLSVAGATESYNPHIEVPTRLLHGLFAAGPGMEDRLREAFRNTFSMDVRLDYSGMRQLALRVAREFAQVPDDPRLAGPIMRQYATLDSQGDGFRSFVGVVLSLLLSEGRIILLDEPEAFLHPAQARRLGYLVARYANEGSSQVIVATHNASFLAGIIQSGVATDIFRVNRHGDVTRYHRITADSILELTRSPLLSSQSVLDAVFHRGVVVCEGDADRSIYQTVGVSAHSAQEVLFLHAQSKQTVQHVAALLTRATIPVAAVVDIDILNSASDFRDVLLALAPDADHVVSLAQRDEIARAVEGRADEEILLELRAQVQAFEVELGEGRHSLSGARSALRRLDASASKWLPVKRSGIAVLPFQQRTTAGRLVKRCKSHGLWIVPVGELESWLNLGTRRKRRWVVLALQALHANACPRPLRRFVAAMLTYLGAAVAPEPVAGHHEAAPKG